MKTARIFFAIVFVLLAFNVYSFDYAPECDEQVGKDVFLNSSYGYVTYDSSHPDYDKIHSLGGWVLGLTFNGFDPDIRNVRTAGGGMIVSKTIGFDVLVLGKERSVYNITLGTDTQVANVYHIRAWNKQGTPIRFIRGQNYLSYLTAHPKKDLEMVPTIQIAGMVFDSAANEITITGDVPYDLRAFLIRLNVLEGDNKIVASHTFTPSPGKTDFKISGDWANYEASLIYILRDKNYKLRGVTRFMLP